MLNETLCFTNISAENLSHTVGYSFCDKMSVSIINFMIITLLRVMLESASPIPLCNAQRCQNKVNGAKDAVPFHQHFR